MTEPVNNLDEVVHQRIRLGILTILHEARRVQFGYLSETLGLTAGNLSQHLNVLGKAGLVSIEKGYENNRARTWVSSTKAGTDALRAEIRVLKEIVTRIEGLGEASHELASEPQPAKTKAKTKKA